MTDPEERLRRFRPASPPGDLRARIFASDVRRQRSLLEWAPAAATLVLAAVFTFLSASVQVDIAQQELESSGRSERIRELTEKLGGDAFASAEAARLIALDEEP